MTRVGLGGRAAALVSRRRRLLAAACAAAAVAFALAALRPAAPSGVRVPTAARDLPAGATLRPSDIRPVTVPAAAAPAGIVRTALAGRVLAGPMRRGEPLTDARVVGRRLLSGYGPDLVAVPVRVADAASVRLLHPGDRIDLLAGSTGAADPGGGEMADLEVRPTATRARPLVSAVEVIAVPGVGGHPTDDDAGAGEGALIVVAAHHDQAATLAGPAAGARLSFVIVG
ncbi:MAG TPA: RcpC/CpaB family pilus assembly protein [Streptosporangiaceae bacterium]|nr:RcpC/CpaB family pilus assembly protein [Streptosporangiaceae bacterium]